MGNLEIQYPLWYILLCIGLGLIFALVLYHRDRNFPTAGTLPKVLLGALRFLAVALLSFLLLSPVLKNSRNESKKPIIVVAQDESASIKSEMDSVALRQYFGDLQQVIQDLEQDYEVRAYAFGEGIREGLKGDFRDKSSNQSTILEYVSDLYADQNLGAVIYASDGIFNEGTDPLYANKAFTAPIYTVALGDTTPDRDLYIRQVFHNNIAYLGDKSSIQVDVSAYNLYGQNVTLQVSAVESEANTPVESTTFQILEEDFFTTIELSIPQEKIGLQRYRVSLSSLGGEKSYVNNRKDFFIDVIDARQKILILAASPHPDVAALANSLEQNKNYVIESAVIRKFSSNLEDFDFVILHQLPTRSVNAVATLRKINELQIPKLVIVGNQSNIPGTNDFQPLVSIKVKGGSSNVVQAIHNGSFSLFTSSDKLIQTISQFAPLDAPFGEFSVSPGAEVLLKQRVGKVDTDFPLWVIGETGGVKSGIICAEGLWRWRLYDYLQHENTEVFDELILKTIQYISLKEDKRKFRVYQAKNLLAENEDALFDAELYNQSYELINEPGVTMSITNSSRESFDFGFSKKNQGYYLNAGKLPVGDYSWTASTQYEGERYTASGQFSVQAIEKESYATVANHELLAQLATSTNGKMIAPQEVSQLSDLIKNEAGLKPIFYQIIQSRNAINLKWIFYVLVGLLILEWAIRRYLGTY